jgi:hypothetical protein
MEEAEREEERANRAAQELDEQIQADAMRQLVAKEQQYKARKRANSDYRGFFHGRRRLSSSYRGVWS